MKINLIINYIRLEKWKKKKNNRILENYITHTSFVDFFLTFLFFC